MKRLIILIPVIGVFFSACHVLDQYPLDQVTPETYFTTEEELKAFSNKFYDDIITFNYDEQSDVLIQEIFSDEIYGGGYRQVPTSGGKWANWSQLREVNELLNYVNQCEDKDAVVKYTAISRFFRALWYYQKMVCLGDMPWYDHPLGSADDDLYKARDSRAYLVTKMIEDLDYAFENLEDDSNPCRVDKWAVAALKARVCLFEGTYEKYHGLSYDGYSYTDFLQQAADAAYEIIQSGVFKLYSIGDVSQNYLDMFVHEEVDLVKDEFIFASEHYYEYRSTNHNATGFSLLRGYGGPGFTRKFVNTYLMADGSRFTDKTNWATMSFEDETADRDPRMAQSMRTQGYHRIGRTAILGPDLAVTNTGYQPVKYVQNPDDAEGQADVHDFSTCCFPLMRYGEVLLNYAEAKAELGTLTQNDLDISVNLLRDRVGMPHLSMSDANANPDWYLASDEYGYPNVTGSNQGVILEIRRERTIELVMEGFRYNDLMRWKAGTMLNQDLVGMYIPQEGGYDFDGDGETDTWFYLTSKPSVDETAVNVYEINVDIYLTGDRNGNIDYHKNITRTGFNEDRDYLYPINTNDLTLNPNLVQNPGW